jgi:hypothetical protein
MATTPKVLGQNSIAVINTLYDVYTVPALTNTTVSTITVANRGTTTESFRISVAVAGAANDNKQYIAYDTLVPGNDIFAATIGITLAATDVIRCYASSTNISVNIFGIEEA